MQMRREKQKTVKWRFGEKKVKWRFGEKNRKLLNGDSERKNLVKFWHVPYFGRKEIERDNTINIRQLRNRGQRTPRSRICTTQLKLTVDW